MCRSLIALGLLAAAAEPALAYDGLVQKRSFDYPGAFTTVGGATIAKVQVGYETLGKLNAGGTNAILIPHFFSGNSHFAGRYKADDKAPGYWDALVGPGKPLDTDKYCSPEATRHVRDPLKAQGTSVEYQELAGPLGHVNGGVGMGQAAETLTKFLSD